METLGRAFTDALQLLWNMESTLLEIVGLTLQVTLLALAIALLLGIPIGAALGLARRLPGRALLVPLIYTGMGLPPVVVGLFTSSCSPTRGQSEDSGGSSPLPE